MTKDLLKKLSLLASLVLLSIFSFGQISWEQFSPMNTGSNGMASDGINSIKKIGDTIVFLNQQGLSLKHGNQWEGMESHVINLEWINDLIIASNGKMYVAADFWGVFEVSGPDYMQSRNSNYYNYNNSIIPQVRYICIEEDAQGKIWFGTLGSGIWMLNGSTWTNYSTQNSNLLNDTIYSLKFHSGKMFVGTYRGLSIYNSGSWTNMPHYSDASNGLENSSIVDLFFDNQDSLWLSTYWGAYKWDGDTSFSAYHQSDGLYSENVHEITQDTLGNIWFLHQGSVNGLTKYDGSQYTIIPASGTIGGLPYSDIRCMEFDNQNSLWVGTDKHGVMKLDGSNWQIYDMSNKQSNQYVYSAIYDSQGYLWSTTNVPYYNNEKHYFAKYKNGNWTTMLPQNQAGVNIHPRVYHQLLDDAGRHWFSSRYNGASYEKNGVFYTLDTLNSSFPNNRCDKFAKGKNGSVWVATRGGLAHIDAQGGITVYNKANSGISSNYLTDVILDTAGTVWVATYEGISHFDGNSWATYDTLDYNAPSQSSSRNQVYAIGIDHNNHVWASIYGNGLVTYDGTNWTHHTESNSNILSNYIYHLYKDSNDDLWATVVGNGLIKLSLGDWRNFKDTIHKYRPADYFDGEIHFNNISEDNAGNLIIGSHGRGIIKLNLCPGTTNNLSIVGDSVFCTGDSTILQANNSSNMVYEWYKNGTLLPNETNSTLNVYTSGKYYSRIIDTIYWCTKKSEFKQIQVSSNNFNLDFTSNDTNMTSPPFNATLINQTPNLTNYSFYWEFGDGASSTYYHPYHQYLYNGTYDIKLTATHNTTGCKNELVKTNFIKASGGSSCNLVATINPSGTAIICSNDSILLNANTGANYTYKWAHNGVIISGADSSFFYAKQVGHYAVIIDNGNCTAISQPFILNHFPSNIPQITGIGSLTPCTSDSMQLTLNSFYQSYQWSTGDTSTTTWINQTGYYYVDVVDQFGCNFTSPQFQINSSFLQPPSICIVGVDSTTGKNRIIWERQATNLIDSIVVFRETNSTNVYERIGSLPYSQSGIFIDQAADPTVRAWRYKLAAVDTCGALSLYSPLHKTIHLTINSGLNGSWNLIWDNYVGFNVNSYFIYRGTSTNNMQLIAQVPGNLSSFTDLNPPPGTVYYELEIIKAGGCYPDSVYSKGKTSYNSSRSNNANNGGLSPVFLTANFDANIKAGSWPIKINFSDMSLGSPDEWYWNFGDGNNSNQQNPSHTYNNSGQFTVGLRIKNGLYSDSIQKQGFIIISVNGEVEFFSATELKVFPNPNNGKFTIDIQTSGTKSFNLRIFNLLGEQVHAQKLKVVGQTLETLDLRTLSKGVYFIRLDNKYESINRKIVID